jgi:hypothetical protein
MHRVTLLRNDPAAGWLTGSGRMGVLLKWGGVWVGYFLLVRVVFFVAKVAMDTSSLAAFDVTVMGWSFPRLAAVAVAALMLVPARHLANVVRAGAQARAAKQDAGDEAQAIDDYAALAEQAEGTVVSLVGWVRGHGYLEHTVGGHQAVGLALPCRGLTSSRPCTTSTWSTRRARRRWSSRRARACWASPRCRSRASTPRTGRCSTS